MSCGRSISGERRAGDKFGSFTKDSMVVEIEFVLSGESEAVYCQIYLAHKGKIVNIIQPTGTYSMYIIHNYFDGTITNCAKHELVKGMDDFLFEEMFNDFQEYDNIVKLIFIGIITVIVAFKDAVYIFYYEMYLKYCQDTDVYQ
jgi:hypothetical protein